VLILNSSKAESDQTVQPRISRNRKGVTKVHIVLHIP
jgi:hypothetical protein